MKHLLAFLFLIFLTNHLSAREDKTKIAPIREVVGMSFPGDVPLYGQHFVFPCEIINAFFDAGREEVTLLLKVPQKNTDFGLKGYLLVVDLKTNSVKWSRKVSAFGLARAMTASCRGAWGR